MCYLTGALNADSMVFGIMTECPIMSRNKQLALPALSRALQVTWLIGDAHVISYSDNSKL